MTVTEERPLSPPGSTVQPPVRGRWALRRRAITRPGGSAVARAVLVLLSVADGLAFLIVSPDVNDLWAARARASAAQDGVGLTYWFSWFGGGSTPGNYSVLTPYLSAFITAELLCALSAVAIPLVVAVLLRGTRHPYAGTGVALVATGVNLWSGRVPFLFSAAIGLLALLAIKHQRRLVASCLALLSILASPVAASFMAIGLIGTLVVTKTREYRKIALITLASIVVGLAVVALVFGAPGPEPFPATIRAEAILALGLLLLARPPSNVNFTIWLSIAATLVLSAVPNGMGSNFVRFVWFCLPVVIVATSSRRAWVLLLLVTPVVLTGAWGTYVDLRNAARPISSVAYYRPLTRELDTIPALVNYRVEVVDHGSHAGYDALLGHAQLARGWETQEDLALNSALDNPKLDHVTYKVWLDNNAVGYVALPASSLRGYAEYSLVRAGGMKYLTLVWHSKDWKLFKVADPSPMVGRPGWVTSPGQAKLTVDVPCACTVGIRVHYSKFLRAGPNGGGTSTATLANDGSGWTTLTTSGPGEYVLKGSLAGGLLG